jgi:hypothetical protein
MTDNAHRHDDADRRFAERLAVHFTAEPLSPQQRARFDARLRERIERRGNVRRALPALAGAVAAAVAALAFGLWPAAVPEPGSTPAVVAEQPSEASPEVFEGWEAEVLLAGTGVTLDEEGYLPDDYVVIAAAFLDE